MRIRYHLFISIYYPYICIFDSKDTFDTQPVHRSHNGYILVEYMFSTSNSIHSNSGYYDYINNYINDKLIKKIII